MNMRQYLIIAERGDVTFIYLQEATTNANARWAFIDHAWEQKLGHFKRVTAIIVPLGKPTAFLTSFLPSRMGEPQNASQEAGERHE